MGMAKSWTEFNSCVKPVEKERVKTQIIIRDKEGIENKQLRMKEKKVQWPDDFHVIMDIYKRSRRREKLHSLTTTIEGIKKLPRVESIVSHRSGTVDLSAHDVTETAQKPTR